MHEKIKIKDIDTNSTMFPYCIATLLDSVLPLIEETCEHNFTFAAAQQTNSGLGRLL
jgi:hypothetical protein